MFFDVSFRKQYNDAFYHYPFSNWTINLPSLGVLPNRPYPIKPLNFFKIEKSIL